MDFQTEIKQRLRPRGANTRAIFENGAQSPSNLIEVPRAKVPERLKARSSGLLWHIPLRNAFSTQVAILSHHILLTPLHEIVLAPSNQNTIDVNTCHIRGTGL